MIGAHHPEVHDGVAQLGVDHGPQAVTHLVLAARPRGTSAAGGVGVSESWGMKRDSTCVATISGPMARGCRRADGAGNMGTSTAQGAP